jgi:alpha-L-fucosidase
MTTSRKDQWAWGGPTDGVKSLQTCLGMLIRCAGGDGNVLLNVGPMPTGEIAPEQAHLLRQMGAWLAKNGESIYGTRGGPFKPGDYGVSTRKGNTIYLHILEWLDDTLKLPAIPAKVVRTRLLSGGKADVRQTATGLEVCVPETDRQPLDTIVALELDCEANRIPAVSVPGAVSLTTKARATASNSYQNQTQYGADKAVDGKTETRWACDAGVRHAWLEVDLGRPRTFDRVRMSEAFPNRVRKFELEYLDGSEWRTFRAGTVIGESWTCRFVPVTAQRVRLNIIEATDGPTLWEFQLFETSQ